MYQAILMLEFFWRYCNVEAKVNDLKFVRFFVYIVINFYPNRTIKIIMHPYYLFVYPKVQKVFLVQTNHSSNNFHRSSSRIVFILRNKVIFIQFVRTVSRVWLDLLSVGFSLSETFRSGTFVLKADKRNRLLRNLRSVSNRLPNRSFKVHREIHSKLSRCIYQAKYW